MEITFLDQEMRDKDEEACWFHICKSRKIPMVKVIRHSSFGDVDWDYITMDSRDDQFLVTEEGWITSELKEILQYYKGSKTKAQIGSFTGIVKNLPIEHVADFALDLCNVLSEAYVRNKR